MRMTSYRCLVITGLEKRDPLEKVKEEVASVMDPLLAGGAAIFGWHDLPSEPAARKGGLPARPTKNPQRGQIAGEAYPDEDVLVLKEWNAPTASRVQAVVLRNGDVHMLAPVAGERPASVLQDGAELRKYDREAWTRFLEAEARNRPDKIGVRVTFDDWDNLLQGDAKPPVDRA
jgi:hypothetical protein